MIIDDEEFSIEALRKYIELVPQLTITKAYTDSRIAVMELMQAEPVDILFLDVDMPLISGIELASVLKDKCRKLVFTTSHAKYAFDAFEVQADAFLLKPFSFAKFSATVARLFPDAEQMNESGDYFLVKSKEEDLRIVKVKYSEVIAFESLQNYVKIHLISQKPLIAYLNIKDILGLVRGQKNFLQFHRAFVISTDCISYIDGHSVKMCNHLTFTVGERFRNSFSDFLSQKLITTARKS